MSLLQNIECCVCLCPFFKAVTLHPCNHTLCETCCINIVRCTRKCPQCSAGIVYFGDNHTIRNIVDNIIEENPEFRKTKKEIKILEKDIAEYFKNAGKYLPSNNVYVDGIFRQYNAQEMYIFRLLMMEFKRIVLRAEYAWWLRVISNISIFVLCLCYYIFVLWYIFTDKKKRIYETIPDKV